MNIASICTGIVPLEWVLAKHTEPILESRVCY